MSRLTGLGRPSDVPPAPAQVDANIRHLVWEITWFGVLIGTTVNFLQVYAVRLGASSLLVGAITYGPALVNILWQLPAARLMNRTGRRMRWLLSAGVTHRTVYLVIGLLPFVLQRGRAELTVLLLIVQAVPVAVATISFLSMLADAVPAERIPQVVGWRMAGLGLTSTASTLLAGRVLQWLPFPINYQALMIAGFLASLVSQWHLAQLRVPDRAPQPDGGGHWRQEIGRTLRDARFARFVVAAGTLQLAIGMIAPLLPLFWVRRLGASDGQISIIVTTASAMMVLGSLLMRRTVRLIGRERALAAGALGYALHPLLTSLSTSVWWLVPWAALGGFFNAAISVTLFDNLVSVTPEADRTSFIAVHNVCTNVSLFAGPVAAGLLAQTTGGPASGLQVASGVALVAGAMFVVRAGRGEGITLGTRRALGKKR